MQLTTVESTMLYAAGYDEQTQALEVVFRRGGIYRYRDVPKPMFEQLMKAGSKGQHMRANIIGKFATERIR